MATSSFRSKPHADVLTRVFDLPGHGLTQALAEGILALDFPEDDAARIEQLNMCANEGQLTDDEEAELEAYINVGDLFGVLAVKGPAGHSIADVSEFAREVRRKGRQPLRVLTPTTGSLPAAFPYRVYCRRAAQRTDGAGEPCARILELQSEKGA